MQFALALPGRSGVMAAVVLSASALSVAGCSSAVKPALESGAPSGTVLKIMSSLPRTSDEHNHTTAMVNGIRMAIEEVGGKIDGYEIVYEDLDDTGPQHDGWDPAVESRNAHEAAADRLVVGYLGSFNTGAAQIAMPILNRAGCVMVSPSSTYPGLTKPGFGVNEPGIYRPSGTVNFFRVVPTDDLQGAAGAEWAKELGATKVFVLHDRERYGEVIAAVFEKRAREIGLEILKVEGIDPRAADYRSLVPEIRSSGADFIYFGGTLRTNAGQLAKDLRSGGVEAPLMVPDGCFEEAFIRTAGAANLNGKTYLTFGGLPADRLTGRLADFSRRYEARHGVAPEAYAIYGHEAAHVLLAAIDRAETKDRASILAAVAATREFDGAKGTWSFDGNGDTSMQIISGQAVIDGKFTFQKVLRR